MGPSDMFLSKLTVQLWIPHTIAGEPEQGRPGTSAGAVGVGISKGSHARAVPGTEPSIHGGRAGACEKLHLCLSGEAVRCSEPRSGHC